MVKQFTVRVRTNKREYIHKEIYRGNIRKNFISHLIEMTTEELIVETRNRVHDYGFHPEDADLAWREEACADEWDFRGDYAKFSEAVRDVINKVVELNTTLDAPFVVKYEFVE